MELTLLFWAFLALAVIPLIPVIRYYRGGRHRVDDHVSGAQIDEYELYLRTGVSESTEGTGEEEGEPLIYRKRRG